MNLYPLLSLNSIYLIKLPHHFEENGDLIVMEGLINIPFKIARVFVVRAPQYSIRGQHAHKMCAQFLTCPQGTVEVKCNDGENSASFELNHPNIGLYIPPSIWAEQKYVSQNSTLTVLCDQPYDAEDYIRNYDEYIKFRNELNDRSKHGRKI